MHPISISAGERVRVNFTAFEIKLTSTSRSMERSPYQAGKPPILQTILRPALALGDVVVRFQDRSGPPLLVSPQRPSAGYYHLGSVTPGLREFAVPSAAPR